MYTRALVQKPLRDPVHENYKIFTRTQVTKTVFRFVCAKECDSFQRNCVSRVDETWPGSFVDGTLTRSNRPPRLVQQWPLGRRWTQQWQG